MDLLKLSVAISEHLASRTGLHITVDMHDHTANLRGRVPSADARTVLLRLAAQLMPHWTLIDQLEVENSGTRPTARACILEREWLHLVD